MINKIPNLNFHFGCQARTSNDSLLPDALWRIESSMSSEMSFNLKELESLGASLHPPIRRCYALEQALNSKCEIYLRDERTNSAGTHKLLSAAFICSVLRRASVPRIITETTGHWGIALSLCAQKAGIEVVCVIDEKTSNERAPMISTMKTQGATIVIAPGSGNGGVALSADYALHISASQKIPYVFGSVFGYFTAPQVLASLHTMEELERLDRKPTWIVGSCGGGANLLSIAGDSLASTDSTTKVLAIESASCPILSGGTWGWQSIDDTERYPALETFGLDNVAPTEYIGGLATTLVSPIVAHAFRQNKIHVEAISALEASKAAQLFMVAEGDAIALESSYQLAGVIRIARNSQRRDVILTSAGTSTKKGNQNEHQPNRESHRSSQRTHSSDRHYNRRDI